MTSWMEERDRLLAQTQAFVQQVAAAHPVKVAIDKTAIDVAEIEALVAAAEVALPAEPAQAPILVTVVEPPATIATAKEIMALRPIVSERSQIMERVAAFRARQARINDERDAYYETMQSKIRSELKLVGPGNEAGDSRL